MKPYLHAKNSVNKWGGSLDDYLPIHDFLDSSKATFADMRHRAILHSSFGCYIAERVFGHNITTSENKTVSVRDICEAHIIEDMGRIPSPHEYLEGMPFYDWLGGKKKEKTVYAIKDGNVNEISEAEAIIKGLKATRVGAGTKHNGVIYHDPGTIVVD